MDGFIPDGVVDRIRSATDIVDLVSEYVSLRKAGANFQGLCPFHSEKTPSFTVSPSKQIFHCFGCGVGGDAVSFVMRQEGMAFPDALRRLADRAGIAIPESEAHGRNREEYDALRKANEEAMGFFEASLWKSKEGGAAREYLKKRGMDEESSRRFGIGYSPNAWDGLLKRLGEKGVKPDLAGKAGLAIKKTEGHGWYDRFRGRVMFPIWDIKGRVIGFGGRSMGEEMPKYLNSPESPLFHKSEALYLINLAAEPIRKKGYSIITEGYFDAIACHLSGVDNAVATMGTALTRQHLRSLARHSKNVLLVFDSDAAGLKAAERSLEVFLGTDMTAKVALLPQGDDPDSLMRREGAAGLRERLGKSEKLLDFVIKRAATGAGTIEEKVATVSALTAVLAKIENGVERAHYVKVVAEALKVEESAVREELSKRLGRTGTFRATERKAEQGLNRIEEGLLQIMLQYPDIAEEVGASLTPEDFSDTSVRAIAGKVFELAGRDGGSAGTGGAGGGFEIRLLDTLDDDKLKAHVRRLCLKELVEDVHGSAKGAVDRLKHARRMRELDELRVRIKAAEESGDNKTAEELSKEWFEKKRAMSAR